MSRKIVCCKYSKPEGRNKNPQENGILPEMLPDLSHDEVALSHLCKDVKRFINQVCMMTESPKNVFMGM